MVNLQTSFYAKYPKFNVNILLNLLFVFYILKTIRSSTYFLSVPLPIPVAEAPCFCLSNFSLVYLSFWFDSFVRCSECVLWVLCYSCHCLREELTDRIRSDGQADELDSRRSFGACGCPAVDLSVCPLGYDCACLVCILINGANSFCDFCHISFCRFLLFYILFCIDLPPASLWGRSSNADKPEKRNKNSIN